ncbi:MAG: hypothetical protein WA510_30775, partial [Acidobacteriaceae bacterium]
MVQSVVYARKGSADQRGDANVVIMSYFASSPLSQKQRFNSRAAPKEISTYRRGFPLTGGTGARYSS